MHTNNSSRSRDSQDHLKQLKLQTLKVERESNNSISAITSEIDNLIREELEFIGELRNQIIDRIKKDNHNFLDIAKAKIKPIDDDNDRIEDLKIDISKLELDSHFFRKKTNNIEFVFRIFTDYLAGENRDESFDRLKEHIKVVLDDMQSEQYDPQLQRLQQYNLKIANLRKKIDDIHQTINAAKYQLQFYTINQCDPKEDEKEAEQIGQYENLGTILLNDACSNNHATLTSDLQSNNEGESSNTFRNYNLERLQYSRERTKSNLQSFYSHNNIKEEVLSEQTKSIGFANTTAKKLTFWGRIWQFILKLIRTFLSVVESIFSTFRSKHSVAGSISKPITTNKGKEKVTNNLLAPQVASSQTLNVENMSNMINNNMPNFAGARTYSPSTSASQTTTNRAQGPVTGGAHINL